MAVWKHSELASFPLFFGSYLVPGKALFYDFYIFVGFFGNFDQMPHEKIRIYKDQR